MRGRVAAACAAVLVGLAPAGALPISSSADSVAQHVESYGGRVAHNPAAKGLCVERGVQRADVVRAPSIFRSPSGPAPSQAPPAA